MAGAVEEGGARGLPSGCGGRGPGNRLSEVRLCLNREGGYRAYTFKQRLDPGDWRVDVETEDGRIVGRVSVQVEQRNEQPTALKTLSY